MSKKEKKINNFQRILPGNDNFSLILPSVFQNSQIKIFDKRIIS